MLVSHQAVPPHFATKLRPCLHRLQNTYNRGSQPVVRVPLVVREGLPGGTRVTSFFLQKPGFHSFLVYESGFVSKQINFAVDQGRNEVGWHRTKKQVWRPPK